MFSSSPNYTKLKTHIRLAINRLKLLEKKKTELTQKARKEIADYVQLNKFERAKIRVEHIIREDYLVEAMEIVEMYCDLILARFGLVTQMKALDEGIAEAISSILWVAPRLQSDIQELKIISDILTAKYGKLYAESCRNESVGTISEKLKRKLSIQSPPKILVEKYMIEIAKNYNIPYEPDPNVMQDERPSGMMDAFLIDLSDKNNLGGGGSGSGGMPQPLGFVGFPQAPGLPPSDPSMMPFNYSSHKSESDSTPGQGTSAPFVPYGAPFSYNIPPGVESKEQNINVDDSLPPYNAISPDDNLQNQGMCPKPLPRSKLNENQDYPDLPSLPSVPSDGPCGGSTATNSEDIDFDDLTRRFEELKKKK